MDPFVCAKRGDVDFFETVAPEILLKARDVRDNTVLTVAAEEGQLDCCEVIVKRCRQLLYYQNDSPKWSVLHYVAVANKLENIMRYLITADPGPDLELSGGGAKIPNNRLLTMQDYWGRTALHQAVQYSKHWATKLLLEEYCDFELLRMVDHDGQTCLHIAAEKGDHVAAELMIKLRPDNEFLKILERKFNQTALHVAAQNEKPAIVQLLIKADYSNDLLAMVDSIQQTALHIAAKRGNLETVKLICETDPDKQLVSMTDSQGNTPRHLAIRGHKFEIARLLTEGKDMKDKDAITCAKIGYVDFFNTVAPDILLNTRNRSDESVLIVAAMEGHLDCCEVIVQTCTQLLYHQDKNGWSVLHKVIEYLWWTNKNGQNIMRFLITANSKPNLELSGGGPKIPNNRLLTMQDYWGRTALHLAVQYNEHWATKLLLEADRDFELLRMVDKYGETCLHIVVRSGNLDMVKLMLKAGLDKQLLSKPNSQGNTPLHLAVRNNNLEIVQMLLEADPSNDLLGVVDSKQQTALHYANLDKKLLSMPDSKGNTLLHLAVRNNNLAIVQLLLEADPSYDLLGVVDSKQQTALHYAVEQGNLGVVKLICDADHDKQLLSMTDSQGNTPCHLAIREHKFEIARLLIEGKDMEDKDAITCAKIGYVDFFKTVAPEIFLNARNTNDESVLNVAAIQGHLDCCEVIVERCTTLLYHHDKFDECSVLHDVVAYNVDENIMRFLIYADTNPDLELGGGARLPNNTLLTMQNIRGETARDLAVSYRNQGAIELLREATSKIL